MQIKFLISLIFTFLMGILAIQNTQVTEVNFLFLSFKIPTYAFIIGLLTVGIIISIGFGVFKEIKYKKIIKGKNKKISRLKKEISVLNNSYYGYNVDENNAAYNNISDLLSVKSEDSSIFLSELKKKYSKDKSTNKNSQEQKSENTKNDKKQDMKISTLFSGFEDLENDDFSLKKENAQNEQIPWYMGKSTAKPEYIKKTDDNNSNKKNKPCVDIKSSYSEYLHKTTKKSILISSPKIKKDGKKFKKIKKQNTKKISIKKADIKSRLNYKYLKNKDIFLNSQIKDHSLSKDFDLKDFSILPENSCSIMHLYKQNTDPEKTLSKNSVKERFNWKSKGEKSNQEIEDTHDAISKVLLKNKINLNPENN